MSKISVDYNSLDKQINKKSYKLSDVQHRIEKVAFDIVRFKDGDEAANLWEIQSSDDGDYIVAKYTDETFFAPKTSSNWSVTINKLASTLNFTYKNDPITSIHCSKLGLTNDQLDVVPSYLPEKLKENKKLANLLLNNLNKTAKEEVLRKYPELV